MGVKISELVEKTTANSSDVIPVVDTGTKKMKLSTLLSLIFPIGSSYVTQTNTNPSTILGFGTWERLKGKVVVGLDEDDANMNEIGKTGGEKTHVLTINEMPSHKHTFLNVCYALVAGGGSQEFGSGSSKSTKIQMNNAGGGQAHNNMPPYQVVGYMWIRRK